MSLLSVIVATRDRPGHLERCLAGLRAQVEAGEFEVVVADDGSTAETRSVVEAWRRKASYPLRHEWEENRGFRLARARNRGIRASRGEYLIFLDGDCIPPPGFLAAHRRTSLSGSFLAGARYSLDRAASEALPPLERGAALTVEPRVRCRLAAGEVLDRAYRLLRLKDRPKALGANLSAWKRDLWAMNGFDERFVGWGCEDEDLGRRLMRLGVEKRFAPAAARVIHLWHEADPTFRGRASRSDNAARFRQGFFLGRCRAGLEPRPLRDLRVRLRDLPWLEPDFPRAPEGGAPAELELQGPGGPSFDPRSEVRIGVGPADARREDFPLAHRLIALTAEPGSPEARGEVLERLEEWL